MTMKGQIKADHIPQNKYELLVVGLPPIVFTEVSGIEEELETVDLPDRTKASGGQTKAVTFTVKHPMHHLIEQAAMEAWYASSQDPVTKLYKKPGSLIHKSGTGSILRTFTLTGMFPSKRKLPDLKMKDAGEMAEVEWTMNADTILPV